MTSEVELGTAAAPAAAAGGRRGRRMQHTAALLANLASMCAGVALGWTSPALPLLQQESGTGNATELTAPLHLSEEQSSWVGALLPLGAVVGALPAGLLADRFGRKKMLLGLSVYYTLGWNLVILASESIWLMYIGRFFLGLGVGATTVLVPIYCEEIAEVAIRGALGGYLSFMMCMGILCIYTLGTYTPYYWFTISGCILPLVFLLTFVWMPESPVFLARRGHTAHAKKSLEMLRSGKDYDVQMEVDKILESLKDAPSVNIRKSLLMFCNLHPLRSTTTRAFSIVLGLMIFQQLSGINAVIFYTIQIFNQAGSNLSGEKCTIIIGLVQVVATFSSSVTVDHLGRRFLLVLSTIVMAFCLLSLSIYAYLYAESSTENSIVQWIPLTSLVVYVAMFSLGLGPLPFFMMAELLPEHAKGWGSAIAISLNWKIALIVTKQFPIMLRNFGQASTYSILCTFCLMGALFIAKFVPETKGKTKSEIQESIGGCNP